MISRLEELGGTTVVSAKPWQRVLAFFQPTRRQVTLISGHTLTIFADSHSAEDGEEIFDVLMEGSPPTLDVVARLPRDIVRDISCEVGLAEPDG